MFGHAWQLQRGISLTIWVQVMCNLKVLLVICPLLAMTLKQCPYYKREPIPNEITDTKEEQRLETKVPAF